MHEYEFCLDKSLTFFFLKILMPFIGGNDFSAFVSQNIIIMSCNRNTSYYVD